MNNLLEMKHVAVNFAAYGGTVQAVRDISFSIEEGQTVALVGESGCGKSITAKTIMGLVKKPGKEREKRRFLVYYIWFALCIWQVREGTSFERRYEPIQ